MIGLVVPAAFVTLLVLLIVGFATVSPADGAGNDSMIFSGPGAIFCGVADTQ